MAVLRGANPEAGVLVLSASIEPRLRERVAGAGADVVINKATALAGIAAAVHASQAWAGHRGLLADGS